MADYCEDTTLSLSAVGTALVALDKEINDLQRESETHYAKMLLAMQKVDICRAAMVKLVKEANHGVYPPAAPYREFPELSHVG